MTINNYIERVSSLEQKYVADVLKSAFRSSAGAKYMNLFENSFVEKYSTDYGISFINGTATMHAALEAFDIGKGDER